MALATAETLTGRYTAAVANASERLRLARETGQRFPIRQCESVLAFVAAAQGDEARCRHHAGRVAERGRRPGRGGGARRPAGERSCSAHRDRPDTRARVRSLAQATGQPWALAVAARCRALLAWSEDAEPHFAEALRLHQHGSRPFELARTGLRRVRRRRSEARVHLRAALELFERLGATPWGNRARLELRASGETARPRPRQAGVGQLTPQELQVARLAAKGGSNRDIAAQLFLSPRTVGYHLHNVFAKLGLSSRAELIRLDAEAPGELDTR